MNKSEPSLRGGGTDATRIQGSVEQDGISRAALPNLSALSFASTAELQSIDELVGQGRAVEAVRFGTKIDNPGFNLSLGAARFRDGMRELIDDLKVALPLTGAYGHSRLVEWIFGGMT